MSSATQPDPESLALEATTMALYVTIALIATIIATGGHEHGPAMLQLIWGAAIGLTLAHLAAFRLASHLARGKAFRQHDLQVGTAQLGAAIAVAVVCSVPVLVLGDGHETAGVLWVLVGVLGLTGFLAGRESGAGTLRSLAIGGGVAAVGVAAAIAKFVLGGH